VDDFQAVDISALEVRIRSKVVQDIQNLACSLYRERTGMKPVDIRPVCSSTLKSSIRHCKLLLLYAFQIGLGVLEKHTLYRCTNLSCRFRRNVQLSAACPYVKKRVIALKAVSEKWQST